MHNIHDIYSQTRYAQYGDRRHRASSLEDISEFRENYINPNSTRPIIYKIPDHDSLIKVLEIDIGSHIIENRSNKEV